VISFLSKRMKWKFGNSVKTNWNRILSQLSAKWIARLKNVRLDISNSLKKSKDRKIWILMIFRKDLKTLGIKKSFKIGKTKKPCPRWNVINLRKFKKLKHFLRKRLNKRVMPTYCLNKSSSKTEKTTKKRSRDLKLETIELLMTLLMNLLLIWKRYSLNLRRVKSLLKSSRITTRRSCIKLKKSMIMKCKIWKKLINLRRQDFLKNGVRKKNTKRGNVMKKLKLKKRKRPQRLNSPKLIKTWWKKKRILKALKLKLSFLKKNAKKLSVNLRSARLISTSTNSKLKILESQRMFWLIELLRWELVYNPRKSKLKT